MHVFVIRYLMKFLVRYAIIYNYIKSKSNSLWFMFKMGYLFRRIHVITCNWLAIKSRIRACFFTIFCAATLISGKILV